MARWKKRTESDEKVGYEFKNGKKKWDCELQQLCWEGGEI